MTPFFVFSQYSGHNRPSFGISLGYKDIGGIIMGAEVSYPITKSIFIDARIQSPVQFLLPTNDNYGYHELNPSLFSTYSIGLGYVKPLNQKVDFTFGLNFQVKRYSNKIVRGYVKNQKSIILPFEIVLHINKRLAIKTGFSPYINLTSKLKRIKFCSDPHLTFDYKF